jgi:hypothetical protein
LPALQEALKKAGLDGQMRVSPTYGHALAEAGW